MNPYAVELTVKRLDLIYPEAPGNKYFKLKYNLLKAQESKAKRIVTVGGPFSNHLHAVAASCRKAEILCTGIVRGERPEKLSPTLIDCLNWGMELEFMPREHYDEHRSEAFKQAVRARYQQSYFIPEGGNNYLGVNGCMEILNADDRQHDAIAVPVGSGTTLAGIALTSAHHQRLLAFPATRDKDLPARVRESLYWTLMDEELADALSARMEWFDDYTFNGFARLTPELEDFMNSSEEKGLPLDRVYTAKMMFGLYDLVKRGVIAQGESVLAVHTGGLQGNRPLG